MERVKFNKKTGIIAGIIFMVLCIITIGIVNAGNSAEYVAKIIDSGTTRTNQGGETEIKKQIIQDNDTSLIYQVDVKNTNTSKKKEIVLFIDTSRSIDINDADSNIKVAAKELVETIYGNFTGNIASFKIYTSSNEAAIVCGNKSTALDRIDKLTNAAGRSAEETLQAINNDLAQTSANDRYLITFTDATDTMANIKPIQDKGINAITILTNMTRMSYEDVATGLSTVGSTYMLDEILEEDVDGNKQLKATKRDEILELFKNSLKNIKVTDVFSQEIIDYFNFEVVEQSIIDSSNETIITPETYKKTNNGYEWTIDKIDEEDTARLKFKLTIKDNITIDEAHTYTDIATSTNMNVHYNKSGKDVDYNVTDTPVIQLVRKYKLKIKAVSEDNNAVPVDGIPVEVTIRKDGKPISRSPIKATTDAKGYVEIDNLKETGELEYIVSSAVSNKAGYANTTNSMAFTITDMNSGTKLDFTPIPSDKTITPNINDTKREVEVVLPIATKKFTFNVDLSEEYNKGVKLPNIKFQLIQPQLNKGSAYESLFAPTNQSGIATFYPTIMPEKGKYEYILIQKEEFTGYDQIATVLIFVEFDDNGNVVAAKTEKYNKQVTAGRVDDSTVLVNVANTNRNKNVFNFEIELSDKDNNNEKLEGVKYHIVSEPSDSSMGVFDQIVETDANGKINVQIPGSGFIDIHVTEVQEKLGYFQDKKEKIIHVRREDGVLNPYYTEPVEYVANTSATQADQTVHLKLFSQMNATQSVIQVKVVDYLENDIPIPGVKATLTDKETGMVYEADPSDIDGIINFIVYPKEDNGYGYVYEINIDNSTLTPGYSAVTDPMEINVKFDSNKEIYEGSEITGKNLVRNEKTKYNTNNFDYKGWQFRVGIDIDAKDAWNFIVNLTDWDTHAPIDDSEYTITISDVSGVNKPRVLTGRKTDANGIIRTRLLPLDGMVIQVIQTNSKYGYKIDGTIETITLRKNAMGQYELLGQSTPYDLSDGRRGVIIDPNDVTYYHTNNALDNTDLYLALNIEAISSYLPCQPTNGQTNRVPGRMYKITSDTILDENGEKLDQIYVTDSVGQILVKKLKVTGVEYPTDSVHILNIVEVDNQGNPVGTGINMHLDFKYRENSKHYELVTAYADTGNRLIEHTFGHKTVSSAVKSYGYESILGLHLYADYEETGNFGIDFRKIDADGNVLEGAVYDITTVYGGSDRRPNTLLTDEPITDGTEIDGYFVTENTTITIDERKAPVGYMLNRSSEVLRVEAISSDGRVVLDLSNTSDHLVLNTQYTNGIEEVTLNDGTIKTIYHIDLIDDSLNTFKLGTTTKSKETQEGLAGFQYYIFTDKGAQAESPLTNTSGKAVTRVGGNYTDPTKPVKYTIKEIETAKYYKPLQNNPIEMLIYFNDDGTVNADATIVANASQPGYNDIWLIANANVDGGNDIDIEIVNQPQDPLNVNLHTIDRFSGAELTNIEYKIEPTVELPATGTQNIEVGYVVPGSLMTYNLTQIKDVDNYNTVKNEQFSISYDKDTGDISSTPTMLTNNVEYVSHNGKTVELNVYIEPKVPFVINAKGFFNDEPLEGTEYTISQKSDTANGKTKATGLATIYNGPFGPATDGAETEVTYTITENKVTLGYVKLDPFNVKVTYNKDREIIKAELLGEANKWINVNFKQPSVSTDEGYNGNDKGIVQITLKHYPEFLMHIENQDSLNNTIKLAGTQYAVIAEETGKSDNNVVTGQDGIGTAHLDKTLIDDTIIYTIKETRPSALYQSIREDVKVKVSFDKDGYVTGTPEVIQGQNYAEVHKIANITDPRQNFEINVIIRNCKMLKFNITSVDVNDQTKGLRGLRYNAESTLNNEKLDARTMQTDINGQGTLGMDKDYASETIKYTITQTEKLPEYQFPSEELEIEVTFTADGRIATNEAGEPAVRIVKGSGYTSIISIDPDTLNINLKIVNYETEEFGVRIYSTDKYDESIGLENIRYKAYLMDSGYHEDSKYTGESAPTDQNGLTYIGYNKYDPIDPNNGDTRTLVIEELDQNSNYRQIRYPMLVSVTFDANGRIIASTPLEGHATATYCAGALFLTTGGSGHTLSVTIHHFPMLFLDIKAEDMYTGDPLGGAKYTVSTHDSYPRQGVSPGYTRIDYKLPGYGEFLGGSYTTTDDGEWTKVGVGPTMQRDTADAHDAWRTFYIYEQAEPSKPIQYQKYRPYYFTYEYQKHIGILKVYYDAQGRIEDWDLQQISNNNIQQFIEVEKLDGQNLGITIKYAPITTMEVTAVDSVSEAPLSNVKIMPHMGTEYGTKGSHEYRTIGYYATDRNGKTNNTYWGENINKGQKEFHINTSLEGWKGYFPSGEIVIHVDYDDYGRIAGTSVLTTDETGTPNAKVDPSCYGTTKLKVTVPYSRKFNLKINKQDEYDENMHPSASFNIQSDKGANTNINSGILTTVGRVVPGEKVTYTLSETKVPSGYLPLNNIKIEVTFNNDGTIKNFKSDNKELCQELKRRGETDAVRATMEEDLEIAVKNEPEFMIKLNLTDKYYNEKKLEGVAFSITSDKGDIASGNPVTNNAGQISVAVGKTHLKKDGKVTYTIKQTSTPNGYYTNSDIVVLEVKFNELGKIETYTITQGESIVTVDPDAYKNQRQITLNLTNKPKNIDLGIKNIDKLTKEPISGITYNVKAEEVNKDGTPKAGGSVNVKDYITNADGSVLDTINNFKETPGEERIVNYTITQVTKPNSYRKIQDIVIQVIFAEDGSMKMYNVLSNPSNVSVSVAIGKLKYINGTPVHILLSIENDNAYDLIIKNEDKNFAGLGIEGTKYDISINGEEINTQPTNKNGLVKVLSRTESGLLTIGITENTIGKGYLADMNNSKMIQVQKGEVEYTLQAVQNYPDVVVDEEHGTITVTFYNETRSSITLVKDNSEVRYSITESEKVNGQLNTIRQVGTDVSDPVGENKLRYELGVTPQNKEMVYTISEETIPANYNRVGSFEVTVKYDMFGRVLDVTSSTDRAIAIEEEPGTNDILVMLVEGTKAEDGETATDRRRKFTTLTVVKDNKDVKYKVTSVEIKDDGQEHNSRILGNEANSSKSLEQLYYEIGALPTGTKQLKITAEEIPPTPSGYTPNGTITVIATLDEKGFIETIEDDCDNATAKLASPGWNNIILVIGKEYGNVAVLKGEPEARYQLVQKEGQSGQEKQLLIEDLDGPDSRIMYYSFRQPIVDKNMTYLVKELSAPENYTSRGIIEVAVTYNVDSEVTEIINNNMFVEAYAAPERSSDVYIDILSEDEIAERQNYTIRVVSQEAESLLRINGSTFNVSVRKGENNVIPEVKGLVTGNFEYKGYVVEKGVALVEEIKESGIISIYVDQQAPAADGYKFGQQKTSATILAKVQYNRNKPMLEIIDYGGLDPKQVYINQVINEIDITINNEAESTMQIFNALRTKDENNKTVFEPIGGTNFTITSEIHTPSSITVTDLNVTTGMTDDDGNTSTKVGTPHFGKTVIYTIHQEITPRNCKPISDVIVRIDYDTQGIIKYGEILSNPDDAYFVVDNKGTIASSINGRNDRVIDLQIVNEPLKKEGYKVVFVKRDIDDWEGRIPNAKFRITVEEEKGVYGDITEGYTNQDGELETIVYDGYGNLEIKVEEIEAPEGYIQAAPITYNAYRNQGTGIISYDNTEGNYMDVSEDDSILYIQYVNTQKESNYSLVVNKINQKTRKQITESSAKFNVKMYNNETVETEEGTSTEEVVTNLGTITTDSRGRAKMEQLNKPTEPGTYIYEFTEIVAPNGYIKQEDPIKVQIQFVEDSKGQIVMCNEKDIQILSGEASIRSKSGDVLSINIDNLDENDLDKYALDITKVDAETGEPIEDMAVFKVNLPDKDETSVYTETMTNDYGVGKLDYCYIEQDKDYSTRLTRMKIPTVEEVENAVGGIVTHTYKFNEILPPTGYVRLPDEVELNIVFKLNSDENKVYIDNMYVTKGSKYIRLKTEYPCTTDTVIKIDILNNAIVYKVEYNANDNGEGTNNLPSSQVKGEDIDLTVDSTVPARDGYVFKGWATDPYSGIVRYLPGDLYTQNADLNLYAVWEKATFKVMYNDNVDDEDITVPDEELKEKDKTLKLSKDIPERDGYNFIGWATDKDATTAEYQPGDSFNIDEETTLFAIWNKKVYTITYDANVDGATIAVPGPRTKEHDVAIDLDSTVLADRSEMINGHDTKFMFDGWNATDEDGNPILDDDGNQVVYQPGDEYSENASIVLKAIWEEELFLESDEYEIINAIPDYSNTRKTTIAYDKEQIHEYNEGDRYIIGIRPQYKERIKNKLTDTGTTVNTLIDNLITNADKYSVTKKIWSSTGMEEEQIAEEKLVGTNMKITLSKGERQKIELTLVVSGDFFDGKTYIINEDDGSKIYLSGDGISTTADVSTANAYGGRYKNTGNNLLLSGEAFVLVCDILHHGDNSGQWHSDLSGTFATGSSENMMNYIKEKRMENGW